MASNASAPSTPDATIFGRFARRARSSTLSSCPMAMSPWTDASARASCVGVTAAPSITAHGVRSAAGAVNCAAAI